MCNIVHFVIIFISAENIASATKGNQTTYLVTCIGICRSISISLVVAEGDADLYARLVKIRKRCSCVGHHSTYFWIFFRYRGAEGPADGEKKSLAFELFTNRATTVQCGLKFCTYMTKIRHFTFLLSNDPMNQVLKSRYITPT